MQASSDGVRGASGWGWPRIALVGLIALGFAARVWRLGAQSLWLDEALSVVFARPALRPMLSTLVHQDLHPPLYYLLLHFWILIAGQGEFAARFPSVVEGLPAIPATYALGAAVLRAPEAPNRSRLIGLLGATFVALSPFLVYYSQEARMYSLLASLGVLSSLALWKLLQTRERRWWLAYAGFTAAMLYSQYFAGLVVAFQGLYLLGALARNRRTALLGLSGVAGAIALYLPWLPGAYLQVDRLVRIPDFWKGDFQLSFMLSHVFAAFAFGQFAALGRFAVIATLLAAVVGVAFLLLAWRAIRRGGGELYLLVYLLVPFAALYVVLVRDPKFTERYLIAIAPPFYLVVALGLVTLAERARSTRLVWIRGLGGAASLAIALGLVGVSLTQLAQVYNGPGYRKDDNRGAIAYLDQHYQPGDVVVPMMNTWETFAYYDDGKLPVEPLQPGGDRQAAANELNRIAAGHKRMWLVLWNPDWADPTFYVRQSVSSAYQRLPVDHQFSGLNLQLYQIDPSYHFEVRTTPDHPEPVDFGNQLQLLGYDLKDQTVQAGQTGKITLYWKALGALTKDYIVSTRLTDGTFYWWQQDGRPAAFTYPTNYWQAGQIINGQREFTVPPGTPPGLYQLEVGVYGQGGADLDVLKDGNVPAGTSISVVTIEVVQSNAPPDVAKLGVPAGPKATYDDALRLLGASLATSKLLPGDSLDVTLWWQALRDAPPDTRVRLRLAANGSSLLMDDSVPDLGRYPTSRWRSGEVVVDRHRLVVPPNAPSGPAHLLLDLSSEPGVPPVDLGTIDVSSHQRLMTAPTGIEHPADWRIGGFAQLIGYSLSSDHARPGDTVRLTLYWKAQAGSGRTAYTVFAHVLDGQSLILAQQDHPPGDGEDPTTGWVAGEYVVDHYDLTIKPSAKPGTGQIEIGMYDPTTSARLSVSDAAGRADGDRIVVGTIGIGS